MPAMPTMPGMMEKMELTATGDKTNLLGLACEKFQVEQRGETRDIWRQHSCFLSSHTCKTSRIVSARK